MRARWGLLLAPLVGCRMSFDPAEFASCALAAASATTTFQWDGNDHCYSLHSTPIGFDAAWDACLAIGAHLVTYGSRDEHDAVFEALSPGRTTWLGLLDSGGGPIWRTGEPNVFSNWTAGQPTGASFAVQQADGTWLATSGQHAFVCERSLVVTADRVYTLETQPRVWDIAREHCERAGAHLAVVTSASELLTIEPLVHVDTWLGGHEPGENGTVEWITGEPFTLAPFDEGEPNNQDEACLEWRVMGWNDAPCSFMNPSLCEYE